MKLGALMFGGLPVRTSGIRPIFLAILICSWLSHKGKACRLRTTNS